MLTSDERERLKGLRRAASCAGQRDPQGASVFFAKELDPPRPR